MINTFIIFIVMDVIESLQTVLDRVIKPMYPSISYVDVSVMGLGNLPFYRVIYYLNGKMETSDAYKIMDETTSLFNMVGPEKGSDIIINFEKDEE